MTLVIIEHLRRIVHFAMKDCWWIKNVIRIT